VTLNDLEWLFYVKLYILLRRYVYSSEAWLSELGYTLKLVVNVGNRNEKLLHRAVSLR